MGVKSTKFYNLARGQKPRARAFGKNTRIFAQIAIILLFFCIISTVLALTGSGGFVGNWLFELIDQFDIFEVWVSLLNETFDLSAAPAVESAADLANLFNPVSSEFSGGILRILGFMGTVLAKAFFETLLGAIGCNLLQELFREWPILSGAIGVTLGLAVSSWIGSYGSALLYAVVSIGLLLLGIIIMTRGKLSIVTHGSYNEQTRVHNFLGPTLFSLPIPIATTGFATIACLVAAGRIPFFWAFIAGVVYAVILFAWETIGGSLKARKYQM